MEEEQVLRNLHVLSTLSQNDKLMTQDYCFNIYAPTTLRGVLRRWYGEGRDQNAEHVKQTVHQGIALATARLREANDELAMRRASPSLLRAHRLLEALRESKKGMRALMTTYRDDAALTSHFLLLMQQIDDYCTIVSSSDRPSADEDTCVLRLNL